eukprot:CAMPEP_0176380586 /NCGR_PEP_ID=MMETSP0126-20121128/31250_1 /TAXON_ID=141414 ORGANISM="Strombidinopsis acuminatum, Strain SPMC142" /NCGR_SAMPLE_ID=MMETSP0126 /ASSEMBLY_ACC=CAM_ASM_000229 /LENGTH=64 /DNA_ID=CAMNT_0017743999 /DNA_START=93 /DNA_END=287 /DNA_ORIENTATION=-
MTEQMPFIATANIPYQMLAGSITPFKKIHEMHLTHNYNFKFTEVVSAFIRKYNNENRFCMTTIA